MTITLNLKQVIKSVLYTLCGLAAVKFRGYLYWPIHSWQSPLRHLAGPQNDSFLFGHLIKLANEQGSTMYEEWVQKYGKTFRYRGFLGSYQLFTTDPRAIQFILLQQNTFHRPDATRRSFAMLLGEGLLSVDLEAHKRQRRIMSPSFGALQIRMLVPIFFEKSNMLRDHWIDLIHNNHEGEVIDVLEGLNLATLDIIGTAGFGYEFNSFEHDVENELARAFKQMFDSGKEITFMMVVKGFAGLLLGIPTAAAAERDANIETMRRIGTKIIQEKKELAKQSGKDGTESGDRDLLTLLIKSNMAEASNNIHRNQAMSDEEVLGQITTFLVAGHETSGTTIAWALYALTKHPNVQSRLRHELLNAGLGDEPSMAELDKLSYLDYVVRETLRVYPAVPNVGREAAKDIVIPANESFTNRKGEKQKEIKIQKGDSIMIPILAMNRAKEVWGDDALDFRPERWYELPQAVKEIPGVWGNLMTFAHGTYGCIGYRFAVAEIKAILYSLIRSIEFEIDPGVEIEGKTGPPKRQPDAFEM